jgi:hypothetical protein
MGGVAHRGAWREAAATALIVAVVVLAPQWMGHGPVTAEAVAPTCPGGDLLPSRDYVISGEFSKSDEGSYVMLPFDVPAGTDAVRLKYCHDQPQTPDPGGLNAHTLDLGIYESRDSPSEVWGEEEFRGWGGSSRPDVTVSPEGDFDPPNPVGTDKTTVGYVPGPIPEGEWAAELGVAAVGQESPAEDGVANWRVEIDLIDDSGFSDQPYQPALYDTTPVDPRPGWYSGDFHVHARHSNPGDATMREAFSYAFCPDPDLGSLCADPSAQPGAGLDFITLSDYVTTRHWSEIGHFQADYPGKLIVRSAEVITYRGHVNNHGSVDFADYRTGRIREAALQGADTAQTVGSLDRVRSPRPASAIFDEIHAAGGWTQINHPETFPSEVPTFGNLCRGCSWEYADSQTGYSKVDAIEIATGPAGLQEDPEPGPNPFTPLAIQFWENAIDVGGLNSNHIAAVGSSDSHNAGQSNPTQSPIGQATTVVRANELSERGIRRGVRAGHTYVRIWGNDGPELRFTATGAGRGNRRAIMGDTVKANEVNLSARVDLTRAREARPGAYVLFVLRNGDPFRGPIPLPDDADDEDSFDFPSSGPGRYRLQVERTVTGARSIEAVSSPIYHELRRRPR